MTKNSATHHACDEMIKKYGGKPECCGCNNHHCKKPDDYQEGQTPKLRPKKSNPFFRGAEAIDSAPLRPKPVETEQVEDEVRKIAMDIEALGYEIGFERGERAGIERGRSEAMLELLQRFNDYEVPLTMTAHDVRGILLEEFEEIEK